MINPRQRIIEVASRLFHQQGYNATGIAQIIAEADVARASLYQHYPSKETICIRFLRERHDQWFGRLKQFTDARQLPREKVLAAFDFLRTMNEEENYRGCSFLNILSEITGKDVEILAIIQSHKTDVREFFKSILVNTNDTLTDHVYLIFEAALIESQVYKNQWPIDKAKSIIESLLK